MASNRGVKNELERMRKEAVVAQIEVLSRNFLGGTEENHKINLKLVGVPAKT
jgi:hypothetical protein